MLCPNCEQPLIEMEFAKGFELVCDNWQCYMYRRPQETKLKEPKIVALAQGYQLRHDIGISTRKPETVREQLALQWRTNE